MSKQEKEAFGQRLEHLTAFTAAVNAVAEYNTAYTTQSIAEGILGVTLDENLPIGFQLPPGAEERVITWLNDPARLPLTEEQDIHFSRFNESHGEPLRATGITPTMKPTSMLLTLPGEEHRIHRINLVLEDGGTFVAFLGNVVASQVTDTTFRHSLATAISEVVSDFSDTLIDTEDAPVVSELLCYAPSIATHLEALGGELKDGLANVLQSCVYYADIGVLRELLAADRIGLFDPPETQVAQKDGPAYWHRLFMGNVPALAIRWSAMIELIATAKTKPKAQELFEELLAQGRASLGYAKADWDELTDYDQTGHGQQVNELFAAVQKALQYLADEPD